MPFINADRIKETTITTGTGNIALLGAVSGFRAFYPTLSVGDTFKYFIVSTSGTEWEAGLGTVVSATTLARTTVQSSSNANAAVVFTAGLKEVGIGPTAGGETPWNPVTNTLDISVNALNDVAITSPTVNQVLKYSGTEWTNQADAVNVGTVTSVSGAGTVSGLTLTGTVTSSGSLTLGGAIGTLNQSTTGNAATVTTNANLTGHVTSVGNAAVLGSFTSAQLAGALSDETGTGAAVFATSPTLVTPLTNSLSAVPVASGAGNSLTIAAGSGVTTGAGGSLILQAGIQATSGGDGKVIVKQVAGQTSNLQEWQNSAGAALLLVKDAGGYAKIEGSASSIGLGNYLDFTGNHIRHFGATTFSDYLAVPRLISLSGTTSVVVQGRSGQTSNLQEWQNSAGTVLASVDAAGKVISNALAAIPVASGLTASVTAASSSGGILTYTAANTFTVGRTVSVTGLTTASGATLNIAGMTIATASSTQFTVVNATVGVSSGTGTATAGGNTLAVSASNAVTAGPGGNYTITAGSGVGVGKGGDIILQPGAQGSSGGNGRVQVRTTAGAGTHELYAMANDPTILFLDGGFKVSDSVSTPVVYASRILVNGQLEISNARRTITMYRTSHMAWAPTAANLGFVDIGITRATAGTFVITSFDTETYGGSLSFPSSTTNIAANTNNLALTASAFQRINCTSAASITGIAPPATYAHADALASVHVDGRMIRVYNVGTANLTLTHNSGLSTTANRYWNSTAADIVLAPNDYAELIYDSTSNGSGASGWRVS